MLTFLIVILVYLVVRLIIKKIWRMINTGILVKIRIAPVSIELLSPNVGKITTMVELELFH